MFNLYLDLLISLITVELHPSAFVWFQKKEKLSNFVCCFTDYSFIGTDLANLQEINSVKIITSCLSTFSLN